MRPASEDLAHPDRLPDLVDALHDVATEGRALADRADEVADEVTALAWAGAIDRARSERAVGSLGRAALAGERAWVIEAFLRRAWPWRRRVRYALVLLWPWWPGLR